MATTTSTTVTTLILSILLNFVVVAFAATTPPYTPTEYILLDCGSTSNSTSVDERQWQADILSNSITNSQTSQASDQGSSVAQIPYMTARISQSEFTYSFPSLSSGPKFLRLYFYPATYNQTLNKTASFFTVTANENTLLSNFSAFLTVSSLNPSSPTLIKEYIIHINDTYQQLNITFLPNHDSFAFVNGIEIVSIPDDLYFKGDNTPIRTGTTTQYYLNTSRALETLYRLNVGDGFVPGTGDTGMFRSWNQDNDYLLVFATGLTAQRNVEVNYSASTPAYTAPEIVYTSARFMNQNYSLLYNMTWVLPVDSGFYYLLRLHFCEFFLEIRKPGDRMFDIFINNQRVERAADVITWANGPQKAVFRDYVAFVADPNGQKGKQDLWLSMKPDFELNSVFDNALLNGLEIFKISLSNGSLNSPNPDLPQVSSTPVGQPASPDKKKSKSLAIIVGVVGGVTFVVVVLMAFLIFRRRRRVTKSDDNKEKSHWVSLSDKSKSTKTSITSDGSLLPTDLCRHFSLEEIVKATGNFDDNVLIGVGGFGNVYKGFVDNGRAEVAIKRLNPSSNQGKLEFFTEIEMLSKLRHLHVVSLIGYCDENGEMILVYDYISRGTLREHLYNSFNPSLTWKRRLQICVGAAKGLHYLHTSAKYSIIHRDVKSTNILLDEKWVAKVSDFGLSKVGPMGGDQTHVSTMVKGSFGYVDPEYYRRHQLTEKSDVYSFGVVLFEVLCSRPPIIQQVPKEQVNLANWVRLCYKNDTISKIIDPTLKDEIVVESFNKFVEIGVRCLKDKGIERPAMSDVVWSLEFALQLQEAAEKRMESNDGGDSISSRSVFESEVQMREDDTNDMFSRSMEASTVYSNSKNSGYFSGSGDGFKSQSVFSEIIQPSAR
ncbi:hypothetical protein LIER_05059 [Lithospermum erythrorhizon]|uniref:Protein kinase domain-containing protein n=1 Tax=Lithospermum erythrorhizon TaxID=34254 RepID=A0AAV3P0B4_LITER